MSTSFARDYHRHGEIAAPATASSSPAVKTLADHGAFTTRPSRKFPAGSSHIPGSYDLEAAIASHRVYSTRRPRCCLRLLFRVTEAAYLWSAWSDCLADELDDRPRQLRLPN